jgi:hypothetical protein
MLAKYRQNIKFKFLCEKWPADILGVKVMPNKVNGNPVDFKRGITYPLTEDVTFSQGHMLLFQPLVANAHLPYNPDES